MPLVYIVKEESYLELTTLEAHRPWNTTCCTLLSSTNISIIYTTITVVEMQTLIIGVTICKSLQDVLQSDLY